jgi:hypothetical protein
VRVWHFSLFRNPVTRTHALPLLLLSASTTFFFLSHIAIVIMGF